MEKPDLIILGRGKASKFSSNEVRFNNSGISFSPDLKSYILSETKGKGEPRIVFAKAKGTRTIYVAIVAFKHPKGYKVFMNDKSGCLVNYDEKARKLDGLGGMNGRYKFSIKGIDVQGETWHQLVPLEKKTLEETLGEHAKNQNF